MKTKFKWTIWMAVLTPLLIIICFFLAGAGHGVYWPIMILFPWGVFNIIWQDHLTNPFIIAGMSQFVIYGVLIDTTKDAKRQKLVARGILLLHIILVILIFMLRREGWK